MDLFGIHMKSLQSLIHLIKLGPLLFIFYINDISNSSSADNSLFADDAALLVADDNIKKLKKKVHKEVNALHEWLIRNKLTLNLSSKNSQLQLHWIQFQY